MALYYIEETTSRKENPRRFITESRWGRYTWTYKDRAKKYTPEELLLALTFLGGGAWGLLPTPVEVEHEPT